jgi:glycosyltransferase involved in cell wall biosynthesis
LKSSKHIAVICNYELKPERIGGMDRFFIAYDRACKENGHEVDWFFSNSQVHSFYKKLKVFASEGISAENHFLEYSKDSKRYDIVITHFIALCTPFFQKLKSEQEAYIIAVDHNPRPLNGFPIKKQLRNKIKGFLYAKYIDCFVGVSKYTVNCILEDYGSHLKRKTALVYNGVKTSLYEERKSENFGKMIVASHLRESKGIQDLIEAVNLLPEENKILLKIDIYGEGPMQRELERKVRLYRLENRITFKGSSSELPNLLQDYSFLLQPTYMECFSLSILEALAANLPVITTPVGGNPEIIKEGKNGFIFKAGDIQTLTSIINKVLQKQYRIDKKVNLLIKEQFSLERMVEEHIKLLPCT